MMCRVLLLAGIAISSVVSFGCNASADHKLVGTWEGTINVDRSVLEAKIGEKAKNPVAKTIATKMVDTIVKRIESAKMTMKFDQDGTFRGTTSGIPGKQKDVTGTWKVLKTSGREVELEIDQNGKKESSTLVFSGHDEFELKAAETVKGLPEGVRLVFRRVK